MSNFARTIEQEKALKIEGKTDLQLKVEELTKRKELNAFQKILKTSDFLQKGLKAAPYIAGAVEVVKFFVSGGTESEGPQEVKMTPMAINANIKLSGELDAPYDFDDIIFYTPGSMNADQKSSSKYPYYNEPLGVFNLLETPQVNRGINLAINPIGLTAKFRLNKESVKYVINPSSGLKSDPEIFAALEFRTPNPWLPVNQATIHATRELDVEEHVMRTRIVPIDYLDQLTLEIYDYTTTLEGEVFLKIFINFERQGATPNIQHVLWVGSFPLNINSVSINDPLFYNLPYNDIESEVQVGTGVTTDIFAWEKITIISSASFQNGNNNVVIMAPEIEVQSGVTIPQNVKLIAQSPILSLGPTTSTEATTGDIATFCDNGYKSLTRLDRNSLQHEEDQPAIYPNPTKNILNIAFTEDFCFTILSIDGKRLQQKDCSTNQKATLSTQALPSGVYLLKIEGAEEVYFQKFIKQ